MQERSVTVGGVTHELPAPFMVMATQNPRRAGRDVSLARSSAGPVLFKLIVPTTGREDLVEILRRTTGAAPAGSHSGRMAIGCWPTNGLFARSRPAMRRTTTRPGWFCHASRTRHGFSRSRTLVAVHSPRASKLCCWPEKCGLCVTDGPWSGRRLGPQHYRPAASAPPRVRSRSRGCGHGPSGESGAGDRPAAFRQHFERLPYTLIKQEFV